MEIVSLNSGLEIHKEERRGISLFRDWAPQFRIQCGGFSGGHAGFQDQRVVEPSGLRGPPPGGLGGSFPTLTSLSPLQGYLARKKRPTP